MGTINPNTSLLQAAKGTPSDKTPAILAGAASQATFAFQNVQPPSPLYVQRDDKLFVRVSSASGAGEQINITARVLLVPEKPGDVPTIVPFNFAVNAGSLGNESLTLFDISEGFLLSVVANFATTAQRGITFVRCGIVRDGNTISATVFQLFSDYVTNRSVCGWPYGRIVYPTEGPGAGSIITVGNPAVGTDWTTAMPVGQRWRIISIAATLTTSAAVANRIPHIVLQSGAPPFYVGGPDKVVVASQAAIVSACAGAMPSVATDVNVIIGLPDGVQLPVNSSIASSTTNIQVADQWSNIRILIEQWQDGI